MNLKEAFRYQNKLQALLDEAQGILDCDANVTKVANTYLRHKVMPEAEDETVMDVAQTEYAEQITDVARFMLYLMEEKSRLFAAIRKAKDALDMDMDSEVSLNAARQSIARTFKRMNDLRSSEQLLSGGGTGLPFQRRGKPDLLLLRCEAGDHHQLRPQGHPCGAEQAEPAGRRDLQSAGPLPCDLQGRLHCPL